MGATLTKENRAKLNNLIRLESEGIISANGQSFLDDRRARFPGLFGEAPATKRLTPIPKDAGTIGPQTKVQDIARRAKFQVKKIGKTFARSTLPIAGATIGALTTGPLAPAGAIVGAGAGEALRQTLAGDPDAQRLLGPILGDAPETITESLTSVGEEMASMALAETGIGFARLAGRSVINPLAKRAGQQLTTGGGRISKSLKEIGIDPANKEGIIAARELEIELDIAQELQDPILGSVVAILKRAIGTQGIQRSKQLLQAGQLRTARDKLFEVIDRKVSRRRSGEILQQGLRSIEKRVGRDFRLAEEALPQKAPLTFSKEQSEKLIELAGRVRDFGGRSDAAEIERLVVEGTTGELITFVKNLGTFAFTGIATPEKAILKQANFTLRKGLVDSLEALAKKNPEFIPIVKAYREQVKIFSKFKDEFDQKAIRSMIETETPEGLVKVFLAPDTGISASKVFKQALKRHPRGAQLEKRAQRAVLEEVFTRASAEEELLLGNALERIIDKTVRRDTLQAILTPKQFAGLQRIRSAADLLNLPTNLTRPITAQGPSLLAFGQSGAAGVALGTGNVPLALFTVLSPAIAARILISPNGARQLERFMFLKHASSEAAKLSVRSLAVKEEPLKRLQAIPRDRFLTGP